MPLGLLPLYMQFGSISGTSRTTLQVPQKNNGGKGGGRGNSGNLGGHGNPGDNSDDNPSIGDAYIPLVEKCAYKALEKIFGKLLNKEDSFSTCVYYPDKFDSSDPDKLDTFLLQEELIFRDQPKEFKDDDQKVIFIISYLSGDALL
jgi:hypothetical protein